MVSQILSITTDKAGQIGNFIGGVVPRNVNIVTKDNLATVTAAGYLNPAVKEGFTIYNTDVIQMWYGYVSANNPGTYSVFTASISNGVITLVQSVSGGNVLLPVVSGDFASFNGVTGQIKDAGFLPSDSAKTRVVMANGAVTVGHMGVYTDVNGTLGQDAATAINLGNIQAGSDSVKGQLLAYGGSSNGHIIINPIGNTGNTAITIQNAIFGQASVLTIPDPGSASASFLLSQVAAGQTLSSSSSSATPGTIRAITGAMTESAAVMTSGNVVGVRGSVTAVGGSGGFWYGTQGKVIASGTLSGSLWAAGIFGQLDVSAATINAGQVAALWGDWGATGAVATDMTGTSGIKFTNTTANKLNEQINTYGDANFLWNIRGNPGPLSYYLAAGTSAGSAGDAAHCAAQQVLKIVVQGATVYIPVFTQNT